MLYQNLFQKSNLFQAEQEQKAPESFRIIEQRVYRSSRFGRMVWSLCAFRIKFSWWNVFMYLSLLNNKICKKLNNGNTYLVQLVYWTMKRFIVLYKLLYYYLFKKIVLNSKYFMITSQTIQMKQLIWKVGNLIIVSRNHKY